MENRFVNNWETFSNHFKADKKRKLNTMNDPQRAQNTGKDLNSRNNRGNLFDLMKGHYFAEDFTYQDFQRSGLLYLEKGIILEIHQKH